MVAVSLSGMISVLVSSLNRVCYRYCIRNRYRYLIRYRFRLRYRYRIRYRYRLRYRY